MYSDGQGRLGVCLYDDESTDIVVYDGTASSSHESNSASREHRVCTGSVLIQGEFIVLIPRL